MIDKMREIKNILYTANTDGRLTDTAEWNERKTAGSKTKTKAQTRRFLGSKLRKYRCVSFIKSDAVKKRYSNVIHTTPRTISWSVISTCSMAEGVGIN